jgi:integrase
MTELGERVEDYLRLRRALGYKLTHQARLLRDFAAYVEGRNAADGVTIEVALAWATLPENVDPVWWSQRLSAVRGFATHLQTVDSRTEVPPKVLLAHRARRQAPHVYSETEIVGLMTAARGICSPLRAATYETLIGLLAATGLRVGEAIGLDRDDVDLPEGLLVVRDAKFGKTRLVPVHDSTAEALGAYVSQRDECCPHPSTAAFFVSMAGTRIIHTTVNAVFRKLVSETGIERPGVRRPRPHDLRHTFAVRVLLGWYRAGDNIGARLPSLSTYLGHTKPASTYWYLSAVPELLALAGERLEHVAGEWS